MSIKSLLINQKIPIKINGLNNIKSLLIEINRLYNNINGMNNIKSLLIEINHLNNINGINKIVKLLSC